jgi:hypothetical protein
MLFRTLVGCAVVAATLTAGAPPSARAQATRWERQVREQLRRTVGTLDVRRSGAGQPDSTWTGTLNGEESATFSVRLLRGVSYSILGVCDNDCDRLQLVLSTPTRNELVVDRRGEAFPTLRFTPRETMVYRVKVVMDSCRMNPCWFGVAVVQTGP